MGGLQKARQYYEEAAMGAIYLGVFPLLDRKEKNQVEVGDALFQNYLSRFMYVTLLALDGIATCNEMVSRYSEAI